MQFNPKKLPLALDVKIPLYDLWQVPDLDYDRKNSYPLFLSNTIIIGTIFHE
jgi:2-amino-4-hydroxy-6-hydroxymethyldihydropteridine diphosphokinase